MREPLWRGTITIFTCGIHISEHTLFHGIAAQAGLCNGVSMVAKKTQLALIPLTKGQGGVAPWLSTFAPSCPD